MFKIIYVVCLCLLANATFAAEKKLPTCFSEKIKQQHDVFILNSKSAQPTIYMLENISQDEIQIDHQRRRKGMSAGWASSIQPAHWSALFIAKKNFTLTCATMKDGKLMNLDCGKVINICATNMTKRTNDGGGYWMVEDKDKYEFASELLDRANK